MDVDLHQSQKAIENGKLTLREDGIIILVSKCRAGIGERAFFELMADSKSTNEKLDKISEDYVLGYHKAAKLTEVCSRAQMWAVTDLSEEQGVKKNKGVRLWH